jgi:hypothetical protein
MSLYDYDRWENFSKDELICEHTGKENPNIVEFTDLMDSVQELRSSLGVPFTVNSAYRDKKHPIEASKRRFGMHTIAAIDIRVPTEHCYTLVSEAFELGFSGIGINLIGDHQYRFIHLDKRESSPRIWSYS